MGAGASNSLPVIQKLTNKGENHRVMYASSTMQGWRKSLEDAHAVKLDLDASKTTSFFGVYDGHGGAEVAMYCAKRFHTMILEDEHFHNSIPDAIRAVCSRIDDDLRQSNEWRESVDHRGNYNWFQWLNTGICSNLWCYTEATPYVPLYEGSTACVVIIRGNQLTVGNVGDSRCVLSRQGKAFDLSTDHKPTIARERARIERAGGQVYRQRINHFVVGRGVVIRDIYRVEGILSLTRAFGDFALKQNKDMPPTQQMVTCVPGIRVSNITDGCEFLVIASDGIWDIMSSQDVVNFVRMKLVSGERDLGVICESLLDRCLHSRDNSTVILVLFKAETVAVPALSSVQEEEDDDDDEEEVVVVQNTEVVGRDDDQGSSSD